VNQIKNTSRLVGSALALVLAATIPACLDVSDDAAEAPIATLAASTTTTANVGVTTWEVRAEGGDFRVIGRSASGDRKAELVVHSAGERMEIQAEVPEQGAFVLTRDGSVDGATTPALAQLGAAVFADLGTNTHPVAPESAVAGDGLGTTTSASTIAIQGRVFAGWSLWSYNFTTTQGTGFCFPARSSYDARSDFYYSGQPGTFCRGTQWTTWTTTDCRFELHFDVPAQTQVGCNWVVFRN
jgi:hypothetical protein